MAVLIKKYVNNNKHSNAFGKTFGRVAILGTVEIDELAEEIMHECTVTRADTLAVISALGIAVKRKLQDSKRVKIPYLGTFKMAVNTKGEENADDFNMRDNIVNVRVAFMPETTVENGHRVKELTRGLKMQELLKYNGVAGDDDDTTPTGGTTDNGDDNGSNTGEGGQSEDPVENRP